MDPYVRGLDNLAAAAFYNIAIKRTATESLSIPHWYDPVPRTARYPWSEIRVPEVKTPPVSTYGVLIYKSETLKAWETITH